MYGRTFIGITLLLLLLTIETKAQKVEEVEALNHYINFLNESVHGLFTAHALLVLNNKEVNRYVDLDSYVLNSFSNDDVQSNLFDKSDKANYTTYQGHSPLELHKIAKNNSHALNPTLAKRLNTKLDQMVDILNEINQLRLSIDDFIQSHDLNQKESIYGVFEYLERAIKLFDNYTTKHHQLANDILSVQLASTNSLVQNAMQLHQNTKAIMWNLRKDSDQDFDKNLKNLKSSFDKFDSSLQAFTYDKETYDNNVKRRVGFIIKLLEGYITPGFVPVEYELYGKHYYYHNEIARRYFNWSGPGFVRHLNKILRNTYDNFILLDEEPVRFKVIYPMKIDEIRELSQEDKPLQKDPLTAPQRELKFSTPTIRYDKDEVVLEVFDHNMIDRDSISVSFNGEWILENHMLTSNPYVLKIKLKEDQENILIFQAENLGIIAPNTVALAYRYQGQRKRIYLESDLQFSETVKIILEKPH